MTLNEAIAETAAAVGTAMSDIGFTEAEIDRAVAIMASMDMDAMRASQLLLCREPEHSYYLFVAFDDDDAKRVLERCKFDYGTEAVGTSLVEVMASTWHRLWGELGTPPGPDDVAH
jgi:hypothetical protein